LERAVRQWLHWWHANAVTPNLQPPNLDQVSSLNRPRAGIASPWPPPVGRPPIGHLQPHPAVVDREHRPAGEPRHFGGREGTDEFILRWCPGSPVGNVAGGRPDVRGLEFARPPFSHGLDDVAWSLPALLGLADFSSPHGVMGLGLSHHLDPCKPGLLAVGQWPLRRVESRRCFLARNCRHGARPDHYARRGADPARLTLSRTSEFSRATSDLMLTQWGSAARPGNQGP